MKTLVIVDFQKDFCNPNGSLYVPGAEEAEQAIADYIDNHYLYDINDVIFTVDWHPVEHCSFKNNGGEWPVHCVQYSEGAGISDVLIRKCIEHNIPFQVFKKGTEEQLEEYGAFSYIDLIYGPEPWQTFVSQDQSSFVELNTYSFIVCGIAGDFCVMETIKNLISHQDRIPLCIEVFKDGIASIDGGKKLESFINSNHLVTI
jgi:nicotinamidase-related amidase